MNRPPARFVSVSASDLRALIAECLAAAGLADDHTALVAEALTDCDLRGVHSHGVARLPKYCSALREGHTNPNPRVRIVEEAPAFVVIDGDGGLGYLPTTRASEMAIDR
ncbi:unnamed protein product, partial [marine sediment metagenome]